MKKNVQVSIVIPVYNAENYLEECIDSVISQSYKNWEVILVDDGSTDNSGDICDEYSLKYNNIVVYHAKNKGPFLARKQGVIKSSGEYVFFLDADDWIEPSTLLELISQLSKDADVVTSGMIVHDMDGGIREVRFDDLKEGKYDESHELEYLRKIIFVNEQYNDITKATIVEHCFGKLLRKEIALYVFDKIGEYGKYLKIEEDYVFTVLFLLNSKSIVITHKALYHYRYNLISLSRNVFPDYLENANYVWKSVVEGLRGMRDEQCLRELFGKRFYLMVLSEMVGFMGIEGVPMYLFPEVDLLYRKRVILLGAGLVGKDYYRQLKNSSVQIVLWVDSNSNNVNKGIASISAIKEVEYDCILCAALNEGTANGMLKHLCEMGVQKDKIIWKKPKEWVKEISRYLNNSFD